MDDLIASQVRELPALAVLVWLVWHTSGRLTGFLETEGARNRDAYRDQSQQNREAYMAMRDDLVHQNGAMREAISDLARHVDAMAKQIERNSRMMVIHELRTNAPDSMDVRELVARVFEEK